MRVLLCGEGFFSSQFWKNQEGSSIKPTASVSHATYLAAYNALSSLADVERLAGDESLGLSYEALLSILARKIDGEVRSNISYHRRADVAQQHLDRYLRGEALTTIASSISRAAR